MSDGTDNSGQAGRSDQNPQVTREEHEGPIYPQNVKFVGRALIVNNDTFKGDSKKGVYRSGSDIDVKEIYDLLLKLGFTERNIVRRENLTKKELKHEITEAAGQKYDDYGCFLCVIMSFGEPGIIICPGKNDQPDERCELKDIQSPFTGEKCRTLATKPKIYFIMGSDNYIRKDVSEGGKPSQPPFVPETKKIPRECNFITHYSTETDQGNWNRKKASPYIEAVIKAFKTHVLGGGDMDILKLLTRINRIMAEEHASIPLVTSLLTKRYHFRPRVQVS
uniref:Caspase n=1 Tax=Azumapecten farreri TaxID=106299 RepID=G0T523_AZUFA|nr:caspase [Azumapecten farreri]